MTVNERATLHDFNAAVAKIKKTYPKPLPEGATVSAPIPAPASARNTPARVSSDDWQDNLRAPKGIFLGFILGALIWAPVVWILWPAK